MQQYAVCEQRELSRIGRGASVFLLSVALSLCVAITPAFAEAVAGEDVAANYPIEPDASASSKSILGSGTWGTCPWEFTSDGTLTVYPGVGAEQNSHSMSCPWDSHDDYHSSQLPILRIVFVSDGYSKVVFPENSSNLFSNLQEVEAIDFSGVDVSSVIDMSYMFNYCSSLTSIDLSCWDTSNVAFMQFMFSDCSSLTSVGGLSDWDVSSVSDVHGMFSGCSSLTSVGDLSDWDTSSVSKMHAMFSGCSSLTYIGNLSGWDVSSVQELTGLFSGCSALASIGDISGWNTSNAIWLIGMFRDCSSLTSLDLSGWDTSSVNNMNGMFNGCSALETLDISGWDSSALRDSQKSFEGCDSLVEIRLGEKFNAAWCFPNPTAECGMWYSQADNQWYSVTDIKRNRKGIADVYTANAGIASSTIQAIPDQVWTGYSIEPSIQITFGDVELAEGTDYVLTWSNNEDPGTATVTITGAGDYKGSVERTFGIVPGDIARAKVDGGVNEAGLWCAGHIVYTGQEQMPTPVLTYGEVELKSGEDYELTWKDNISAGIAQVIATGKGRVEGTITLEFEILPAEISSAGLTPISDQFAYESESTPVPHLVFGGTPLVPGVDFDLSYSDNNSPGVATVTITGRGNYTGFIATSFTILEPPFCDVTSKTAHFDDIDWMYYSGISRGWETDFGREYRPLANVARADMAAFLYRLVNGTGSQYQPTPEDVAYFSDVTWKTPHCREIWWMAHEGISRGWTVKGRHEFRPYANVARCDMACFLMRMSLGPDAEESYGPPAAYASHFSDVSARTPHRAAVLWLAANGVSRGWDVAGGRHEFRPLSNVARADMAAFLHRMDDKGLV